MENKIAHDSRWWVIRWVYAAIVGHLVLALALPWIAASPMFDGYHRIVEQAFWGHVHAPQAARAQQIWWIGLFGPTVQSAAVWMGALAYFGERQRSTFAWAALIVGIAVWAPQDLVMSLHANCWPNALIDAFAVVLLVPPLTWLYIYDRTHDRRAAA
ncbi:MAG: cell division protein [Pseudomonadota bacterium]